MCWPSRCDYCRVGKNHAAKIVRSFGSLAASGEERPLVGFQQLNPGLDITSVAQVAVNRELGAQKRSAKFGDQFLCRIGAFAEAVTEVAIQALLVSRPVSQLVKYGS